MAREFTKYNSDFHNGNHKQLENMEQTISRYTQSTERILKHLPNVVCLQECSEDFFSEDYNKHSYDLKTKYHIIQHNKDTPGVCVLIHKDFGREIPVTQFGSLRVGGSDDVGGRSKKALGVLVETKSGHHILVCSVHLCWEKTLEDGSVGPKEKANKLLNLLGQKLLEKNKNLYPVILTGDFNMEPTELYTLKKTFLSDLTMVPITNPTGLGPKFDIETQIDHVYSNLEPIDFEMGSDDLKVKKVDTHGQTVSAGPYIIDSNEIQSPSDHIWIKVNFRL